MVGAVTAQRRVRVHRDREATPVELYLYGGWLVDRLIDGRTVSTAGYFPSWDAAMGHALRAVDL